MDHHITATAQTLQRSANKEENRTRQSSKSYICTYIYIDIIESRYMIHECTSYWNPGSSIAAFLFVYLRVRVAGWKSSISLEVSRKTTILHFNAFHLLSSHNFEGTTVTHALSLWWRKILYCFKVTTLAIRGQVWIFSRGTGTTSPPKQAACQCRFNTLIAMSCVATLLSRQEMNGRKGLGNTVGSDHPQLITPQVIQVIRNNSGIVAKQNP